MGSIALLALLSGLLLTATLSSDDDDTPIDTPEEPETPVDPDDPDTPVDPEEPETPPDTGATFDATEQGVQIELGEDETGSLAVIYYTDTEDTGNPDDYLQVDEARFYLVPEGVDWSSASWETQFDIPGGTVTADRRAGTNWRISKKKTASNCWVWSICSGSLMSAKTPPTASERSPPMRLLPDTTLRPIPTATNWSLSCRRITWSPAKACRNCRCLKIQPGRKKPTGSLPMPMASPSMARMATTFLKQTMTM
ncbi:hypothetical protein ACFQFQ_15690 [Sulfitobacter porphyrae]|uniref:Uncharacterized protein n=1 Tax=Sulfitobacter porphyrae TaxID=1246864 RepID=A0ABW2B4E5_9RHOB